MTSENNPRYSSDEELPFILALNPDATDNVLGVYLDARLKGAYKTPSTKVSLLPRIRQTNYLKSNKDLNEDDWYVDFAAAYSGILGSVVLTANYQDTGVRTSEFESAIPDEPDAPGPVTDGSGRFSYDTRRSWDVQPSLSYQLSPRNLLGVTGLISETTYDEQRDTWKASHHPQCQAHQQQTCKTDPNHTPPVKVPVNLGQDISEDITDGKQQRSSIKRQWQACHGNTPVDNFGR